MNESYLIAFALLLVIQLSSSQVFNNTKAPTLLDQVLQTDLNKFNKTEIENMIKVFKYQIDGGQKAIVYLENYYNDKYVPKLGPIQCHKTREWSNVNINIDCGVDQVVGKINFASYGLPQGQICPQFSINPRCHSTSSQAFVENHCLNKQSCSISASNQNFGDPCYGIVKDLVISYQCMKKQSVSNNLVPSRYIRIQRGPLGADCLQISQLQVFDIHGNEVARGKSTSATSQWEGASGPSRAVDGDARNRNHPNEFHIGGNQCMDPNAFWEVDLGADYVIDKAVYYNRADCCSERSAGLKLIAYTSTRAVVDTQYLKGGPVEIIKINSLAKQAVQQQKGLTRFVKVERGFVGSDCLQISQLQVLDINGNEVARGKSTRASSQWERASGPERAVDGNPRVRSHPNEFHIGGHQCKDPNAFWEVDLGANYVVDRILYYNRADCCQGRSVGLKVSLLNAARNVISSQHLRGGQIETLEFDQKVQISQ